jgi:tetratricopeptide (TPR) repeat protein
MSTKFTHLFLGLGIALMLMAADGGCGGAGLESAKIAMQRGDNQEAITALETAIKDTGATGEAYFLLGKAYYNTQNFIPAAKNLRMALTKSGNIGESNGRSNMENAQTLLGECYRQVYYGGATFVNQAMTEKKNLDLRAQYLDSAKAKLDVAIELAPDSLQPYRALSNVYILKKQYASAVQSLEKTLKMDDKDTLTYIQLGRIYRDELHDTVKSNAILETANRKNLANSELLRLLGGNYLLTNRIDAAEPVFQKVLTMEPNDKNALFLNGYVQNVKKNYEKALTYLELALKQDPYYSDAASSAAISYLNIAEDDNAKNKPAETGKSKRPKKKEPPYTGHYKYYQKGLDILLPVAEKENLSSQWRIIGQLYARMDNVDKYKEAKDKEAKGKK